MASKKFTDYWALRAHIDWAGGSGNKEVCDENIHEACMMLDNFWREHCENTKTVFWVLTYTVHDHAAKGMWAEADYLLRQLINGRREL